MKKLLLLLCIAIASMSCEDKAYDLSDIDTGDVTIGGEDSEFKMPLANISITMDQVKGDNLDIEGIFREADIWLPSPLPGGAKSVDLTQLKPGTAYTQTMVDALIEQMIRDEQKLTEVTDLIWAEYKVNFLPLLGLTNPDEAEFKEAFKTSFVVSEELQEASRNVAQDYLFEMHVDPLDYQIGSIDLDDSVVDMLAKDLGSESKPGKGKLYLRGEIISELPVGMGLTPNFTNTGVSFEVAVTPDVASKIPDTRVFENDLRKIIDGANIYIPVELASYYPEKKFAETQKIRIKLSLLKIGGLTLDI